jgi:hypothetical protein
MCLYELLRLQINKNEMRFRREIIEVLIAAAAINISISATNFFVLTLIECKNHKNFSIAQR